MVKRTPLIGLLLVVAVAAFVAANWPREASMATATAKLDAESMPRSWGVDALDGAASATPVRDGSDSEAERVVIAQPTVGVAPPLEPVHAPATFTVEVVDAQSAPLADVAVSLLERDPGRGWRVAASARTNASGRAELPVGAPYLERSVQLPLVDTAPVDVALAPRATWPEVVRFVAKPSGALEVRVLGFDDSAVEDELTISLRREDGPAAAAPFEQADRRTTTNGVVRFEHVALESTFTARAEGAATRFRGAEITGPLRPGETVSIDLAALAPAALIAAQLVGEDGEALRAHAVQLVAPRGGASLKGVLLWSGATDREGRVGISSQEPAATQGSPRKLRLFATRPDGTFLTAALSGGTPSALTHGRQMLDFGVVELRPAAALIAGRVLDPAGAAIAGAAVSPCCFDSSRVGEIAAWPERVLTDADGAFALANVAGISTVMLSVSAQGFATANLRGVRSGARDLEVVLEPRGIVRGHVQMPDALSARALTVQLEQVSTPGEVRMFSERAGDHPNAANSTTATVEADGRFESLQVAPGTWRLAVRLDEETLLTMREFVVEAGAVLDLGQLDLRQRITPLHIDVVDERGEPLPRAMVTLLSERGAWPTEEYTSRAGRASFVTLGAPLDLRVWSAGRRSLELKAVASHQRVTLAAGIAVEFVFPRDLPPLAPLLEFTLSVTDEDAESLGIIRCFQTDWRTRHLLTSRTAPVGPSERWTLHLPHAGDYMVLGHLRDSRTLRSIWSSPRPLGPISIDSAAPAPVPLSFDTASLSSALAAHAALSTAPSQR